jgi:hypothetical protein
MPSWIPECLHWPFCPGVFIAVLAFTAAAVTFRENPKPREKATWTFIFMGLMCAEVYMMSKDRTENNRKQKDTRDAEIASFKAIGGGIQTSITNSQQQFTTTISRINQNTKTVTGGDSFCFIAPSSFLRREPLAVLPRGRYALYNVSVQILDVRKFASALKELKNSDREAYREALSKATWDHSIGLLIPGAFGEIPNFISLEGLENLDYRITFTAVNGFWQQEIKLRLIGGHWVTATQVSKQPSKILFEKVDKEFPRDKNGKVGWEPPL